MEGLIDGGAYRWRGLFSEFYGMRIRLNPLNPNIKIEILISYPYTFSIEVVRRIF